MTQVSAASWGSAPTSRQAKHLSVKQIKARLQQERIHMDNKNLIKPDPMELIEIVGNVTEEVPTVKGANMT